MWRTICAFQNVGRSSLLNVFLVQKSLSNWKVGSSLSLRNMSMLQKLHMLCSIASVFIVSGYCHIEAIMVKAPVSVMIDIDDVQIRNRRFLHYWTLKEAFVKSRGIGVYTPPGLRSYEFGKLNRHRI